MFEMPPKVRARIGPPYKNVAAKWQKSAILPPAEPPEIDLIGYSWYKARLMMVSLYPGINRDVAKSEGKLDFEDMSCD